MKSVVISIAVLAVFELCLAEDDGKYRPEKYSNAGKYNGVQDGQYYDRYRNLYGSDNYYYRQDPYYTQQYYNNLKPLQQLLAPFTDYRNRIDQDASSLSSVTSRPPVVFSTARPIVYTTSTALPKYRDQYHNEGYARIVEQESDADEKSYHYKYLTENGIAAEESASLDQNGGNVVRGFYEYFSDDGVKYRVDYTADANGFHPTGAHLP